MSVENVEGPGFSWAWRITTRELSTNAWDLRVRCFSTLPAKRGDVGVAKYWIRSRSEGVAMSHFVIEQGGPPYSKSVEWTSNAGQEWKEVNIGFLWDKDYPGTTTAEQYNLSFWANIQLQEIEIGGFQILNYGQGVDLSKLNLVGYPYDGAEESAAWRAEAAERIEKHRKSDVEVKVVDAEGKPVAGAAVKVKMKRHEFGFATAVDSGFITGNSSDSQRYREEVLRNFNKVAIENDLKWPFFETWAAGRFERAEQWLRANGMKDIHAHVLVWPGRRNLPADVVRMLDQQPVDTAALRQRVNSHIDQMMDVTRDKATEWDVLNEPFDNRDLQGVLGNGEMAEWFKRARAANPNVLLFLNDYDIVERGGYFFAHMNFTFDVLKRIKEDKGPVDGFGFQSHFNRNLTHPGRAYEVFDKFGAEVDLLQVTEFDVNVPDEEVKALYLRDFLTVSYSHPKMNGFTLWGFWAGRHWLPDAALIKRDWTPTKSLDVWRDLIYKQWWTDVEGVTGEDGVFRTRGFHGDYDVVLGETTKAMKLKRGEKGVVELVQ